MGLCPPVIQTFFYALRGSIYLEVFPCVHESGGGDPCMAAGRGFSLILVKNVQIFINAAVT